MCLIVFGSVPISVTSNSYWRTDFEPNSGSSHWHENPELFSVLFIWSPVGAWGGEKLAEEDLLPRLVEASVFANGWVWPWCALCMTVKTNAMDVFKLACWYCTRSSMLYVMLSKTARSLNQSTLSSWSFESTLSSSIYLCKPAIIGSTWLGKYSLNVMISSNSRVCE